MLVKMGLVPPTWWFSVLASLQTKATLRKEQSKQEGKHREPCFPPGKDVDMQYRAAGVWRTRELMCRAGVRVLGPRTPKIAQFIAEWPLESKHVCVCFCKMGGPKLPKMVVYLF